MTHDLKAEMEAYRSLADLLEQADKVRGLFEQAGSPLPDALQRLVHSNGHVRMQSSVGEFKPSNTPPACNPDWVWVELKSATPGTLALTVLRASSSPLTAREIHERVRKLPGMSEVSVGTIANTGTRAFENGLITRTEDGHWQLTDPDKAGVIHGDHVWGKIQAFQMTELAAHRRNALVHLLRQNPVGLQATQILVHLQKRELVRAEIPLSKALIKADLEAMDGERVRKRGNSKKWEAI
jgi:hypothetical protein